MAISEKLPIHTYFTGDTSPGLEFTINKSDGTGALDVSGATAKCYFRLMYSTANTFAEADSTATIANGTAGRVDFSVPSGGFTDPGVYYGQVKVTLSGNDQRFQRFQMNVEEGL